MPRVQVTKSPYHSEAILIVALGLEETFTQVAPMLLNISKFTLSGDFSFAKDNLGKRLSLISAFTYTMTTDHP